MTIIDEVIRLKGDIGRIPVAPVITSRRELFEDLIRNNRSKLEGFDGFLLHPAVFDSGWVYLPSKPSLQEPIQVIKQFEDYDRLNELGPVEYAIEVHKEKDLLSDIEKRLKEAPQEVNRFVDEVSKWGIAFYCGALGVTPMGYITYFRGFYDAIKDLARDMTTMYKVAMNIAKKYPDFLVEFCKTSGVPRVWISFANATPSIVGDYYFDKIVWPSTKIMLENLINKGITPIIQFDEEIKNLKFLTQLPSRTFAVHLPSSSDLLGVVKMLSGSACVIGNLKIPPDDSELRRIDTLHKLLSEYKPRNLIISTGGESPFVMTADNIGELSIFNSFIK
ncbi:MAG: hypothetical protein DSO07_07480 [Thermoproteota archaeon]|jgi:hypothetical protein|uniref:Uroporphyrinogen decarboxylase (URO-D) domain-containing protein n=1 Tax=Candidatus Methanodesulfokora washburnensis TaxID=2478471 RepID=A0A3R9RLD1_9CREN|nr:hypothetical protein [Candidatus Methanodesulfokores washburnensis]RSN72849.1 hypothetical protein D6D85_12445 [Candidatus Methanodesulfokores washburnensis]RZN63735.1 MAG: hypothetical protein EF810_00090 [Candidatus Methanodesulfokores washburnensis]TDA40868.1 MAG: hypothetical protein DSO07_07480 [Candidatus Korarchaeota archaeon]